MISSISKIGSTAILSRKAALWDATVEVRRGEGVGWGWGYVWSERSLISVIHRQPILIERLSVCL